MQILPAGALFNFVEKQEMYLESIAGESFEGQIKRREKKNTVAWEQRRRSKCRVITRIKDGKEKKRKKSRRRLSEALSGWLVNDMATEIHLIKQIKRCFLAWRVITQRKHLWRMGIHSFFCHFLIPRASFFSVISRLFYPLSNARGNQWALEVLICGQIKPAEFKTLRFPILQPSAAAPRDLWQICSASCQMSVGEGKGGARHIHLKSFTNMIQLTWSDFFSQWLLTFELFLKKRKEWKLHKKQKVPWKNQ